MRPRPAGARESRISTVVISLVSAALGALASQGFDFIKSRQLAIDEQRRAGEQRLSTETAQIYRELFAMRSRLVGKLVAHHFAAIDREYLRAKAAAGHRPEDVVAANEQEKIVAATTDQVVQDRSQLESLLGWADLIAPEGNRQWADAIFALIKLNRWAPTPVPSSIQLRDAWREAERRRAHASVTDELNDKFLRLLRLLKDHRKAIGGG